jgi:hypothetical protein
VNKSGRIGLAVGVTAVLAIGGFLVFSGKASAGPYGGDVVSIDNGDGYAEFVADRDTGEVMVHTWDRDLKTSRPIKAGTVTLGTDDGRVELAPEPQRTDPAGTSSRFYGHAHWLRGSGRGRGWLMFGDHSDARYEFDWKRCWSAGKSHGPMWTDMGEHRWKGMGPGEGHGPGFEGHR